MCGVRSVACVLVCVWCVCVWCVWCGVCGVRRERGNGCGLRWRRRGESV